MTMDMQISHVTMHCFGSQIPKQTFAWKHGSQLNAPSYEYSHTAHISHDLCGASLTGEKYPGEHFSHCVFAGAHWNCPGSHARQPPCPLEWE